MFLQLVEPPDVSKMINKAAEAISAGLGYSMVYSVALTAALFLAAGAYIFRELVSGSSARRIIVAAAVEVLIAFGSTLAYMILKAVGFPDDVAASSACSFLTFGSWAAGVPGCPSASPPTTMRCPPC